MLTRTYADLTGSYEGLLESAPDYGALVEQTAFGQRLYDRLAPWHMGDADRGYPLRNYCHAIGQMFSEVEVLAREDDDGNPPWSALMDVDRAPSKALPWLAQLAGVELVKGLSDTDTRAYIKAAQARNRGTRQSIIDAAKLFLTGTKFVDVVERDGSPYRLTLTTFEDETPDALKVERAVRKVKPAGIVLNYALANVTYAALDSAYGTYTETEAAFVAYEDQTRNQPL